MTEEIEKIKQRIAVACAECLRAQSSITIVAATKTIDAQIINKLPENGIINIGENRTSELNEKYNAVNGVVWHFVGALQTNKVKCVVGKVSLIQSVDRKNLALEIDKQSQKLGIISSILVEVNIGGESAKSGVLLQDYNELIDYCYGLKNIKVQGLMSVLPKQADEGLYKKMNELYMQLKKEHNVEYLSMGMSDDYEIAIKNGSNMVRLGRAIFGARV